MLWPSSLVLNTRSDAERRKRKQKYCPFHHFCLLWSTAMTPQLDLYLWRLCSCRQQGGEGHDKWGIERWGALATHTWSESPSMEDPSCSQCRGRKPPMSSSRAWQGSVQDFKLLSLVLLVWMHALLLLDGCKCVTSMLHVLLWRTGCFEAGWCSSFDHNVNMDCL